MTTRASGLRTPSTALTAWRAELAAARRSPWLATLVLRRARHIARRAAEIHARLAALPRRTRRRLARVWAMALPVAALALAWSHGAANAATIEVGPGCTLADAIRSANADAAFGGCAAGTGADTIVLHGGMYAYTAPLDDTDGANALPSIQSELTILGHGATIVRSPDAGQAFRLVHVAPEGSLDLVDATLTGGLADAGNDGYGAVGGAILVRGTARLDACRLSGNEARGYGGGLAVLQGGDATITGCELRENRAFDGGAAFNGTDVVHEAVRRFVGGVLTMVDSVIVGNFAQGHAGGVGSFGVTTLMRVDVRSNQAGSNGGGLFAYGGSLDLRQVTVMNNEAEEYGGGIVAAGTVSAVDTEVSYNGAGTGGGIAANEGRLDLLRSRVTGNTARGGGGVYMLNSEAVLIASLVADNEAEVGGGMMVEESRAMLEGSGLSGNRAIDRGGGIFGEGATVTFADSHIDGNRAEQGGGLFGYGNELDLVGTTVSGNHADLMAGGLGTEGVAHIDRSNIQGNTSEVAGGIRASGAITITRSTILDNRAGDYAGGMWSSGSLSVASSTIAGNEAEHRGGGLYLDSDGSIVDTTIADNGAAEVAGGAGIFLGTGMTSLSRVILARNHRGGDCAELSGRFTGGGNLVDDHVAGACADLADAAVTGLAPALADNGGPTLTFALLPGSNAIDAAPDCLGADDEPLATDQRGTVRPQDGDGDGVAACDIGAFEVSNLAHRVYLPSMLRP